jgi:predicted TIM-barrel fold metal-dependent hydrolase
MIAGAVAGLSGHLWAHGWKLADVQIRCPPCGKTSEDPFDMIIDVHTHIWTSPDQLGPDMARRLRAGRTDRAGRIEASPADLDRVATCVDGVMVHGFRSLRLGAHVPNELVAEFVRKDPRRRIGICGIDPLSPDALDELKRGVALGLAGVTISPACQDFHPAHSQAMRIYERCEELGLPLFVTMVEPLTASAILEFARPALWDEIARNFPSLPIVISKLGHPWIDEALTLISKHERVFADISSVASRPWQLYGALLSANAMGVIDKLLFASGFPHELPAKAIEAVYCVNSYGHGTHLPTVPRTLLKGIVERDALKCLGIEAEITPRILDDADEYADVPVVSVEGRQAADDRRGFIRA